MAEDEDPGGDGIWGAEKRPIFKARREVIR
jgi:hypothetical protein